MLMEPVRTYALTGATVIDGHGDAPLKDTAVLVDNGVIKAVGSRESIIELQKKKLHKGGKKTYKQHIAGGRVIVEQIYLS
jgi:predicted amidohydrolase YtcJ